MAPLCAGKANYPFLDTVTSQTIEFTFTLVEALNDAVNTTVFGDQYVEW